MRLNWKRSALLATLTAGFAVGGFFLGHSNPSESEHQGIPSPNFSRYPPHAPALVALNNPDRLELTSKQKGEVKQIAKQWAIDFTPIAREQWRKQVMTVEAIESGEVLPIEGEVAFIFEISAPRSARRSYTFTNPLWVYGENADKQALKRLKGILSKQQLHRLIALEEASRNAMMTRAYEVAMSSEVLDSLELSELQRKQLQVLSTRIQAVLDGKSPFKGRVSDSIKGHGVAAMSQLLNQRQRLILAAHVRDQVFISAE